MEIPVSTEIEVSVCKEYSGKRLWLESMFLRDVSNHLSAQLDILGVVCMIKAHMKGGDERLLRPF